MPALEEGIISGDFILYPMFSSFSDPMGPGERAGTGHPGQPERTLGPTLLHEISQSPSHL